MFIVIGVFLLSGLGAAAQDSRDARVRAKVEAMCRSSGPVLVMDSFFLLDGPDPFPRESATQDFDGDALPDGAHGDLVAKIVETAGEAYIPFNIPNKVDGARLAAIFAATAKAIEDGGLTKPSRINYSNARSISIDEINRLDPSLELTPENIGAKREEALRALMGSDRDGAIYRSLKDTFDELEKLDVPVVVASGNDYSPRMINAMSLLPGTITVGALESDGKTVSAYSNENSLVDLRRIGHYFGRVVDDGIDIDGDQKAEFSRGQLSGKKRLIDKFNGRRPEDVLVALPDGLLDLDNAAKRARIMKHGLPAGIYRTRELYEAIDDLPLSEEYIRDIASQGPYMHYPSYVAFRLGADGRLKYDPAGDGDPKKVVDWGGTSYAAPALCRR